MYDRGYFIGYIQYGRINGTPGLRGMTPEGRLLGYERELEAACDRMWEWYIRTRYHNTRHRTGSTASLWSRRSGS